MCVVGAPAVIPTLVSHLSESNSRWAGVSSPWHFYFNLADPATAGNAVIAACQFQGSASLTMSDDQSDSYSNGEVYYGPVSNQSIVIAESFGVAAGAYNLTATFSANTVQIQCVASQFSNLTAPDGAGTGNAGSGFLATAGSMTPTMAGDLVYQATASLNGSLNQAGFTAGSGFTLLSGDLKDALGVEYEADSSTSPINPAMTLGTSAAWISAAVLIKSGGAGGVPGGMRIAHTLHENIPYTTGGGGTGSNWVNPVVIQFPCSGNTLAIMHQGGGNNPNAYITGITDSNGNTWTQAGLYTPYSGTAQGYYAANVTCSSTETLAVTFNRSDGDETLVLYDIVGAASLPLDTQNGGGGALDTDSSTITVGFTLTPGTANELVFAEAAWLNNTGTGVTGTGQLFDSAYYSGENQDGPQPVDQNNGWLHYYVNGTSTISFTFNLLLSTDPPGDYAGMAMAFKSAGSN
jgi:hypothetical protein